MKNDSGKSETPGSAPAIVAVPLSDRSADTHVAQAHVSSELDKRMLLFRLSDAAKRIREEATLIRRTIFTDQNGRLLRILGETVEEQRQALAPAEES